MVLTSVSGYSTAELTKALHSARREVSFRYDILSSSNVYLRPAVSVTSASVENDSTAQIKRTAKFSFEDESEVNWLSERLRPWWRLKMPDGGWAEWPLGLFLPVTPVRSNSSARQWRDAEAYDQLLVVGDEKVEQRYTVLVGQQYTVAIQLLLQGIAGITSYRITPDARTLLVARDWDPGTSKIQIVNELLAAINYRELWFDTNGEAVAEPYVAPDARGTDYIYRADRDSIILPDPTISFDLFSVPNRFVAVVSDPSRDPMRSVFTNDSVTSPTSTVNRGRTITRVIDGAEAVDQTALNGLVRKAAIEASQVYEEVEFKTAAMPFHGNSDILRIDYDRVGPSERYEEMRWSLELRKGAKMTHTVRKIVVL